MRVLIAALAMLATIMLVAPAATALTLPDPNNLPPVNPNPVSQCLGSASVLHLCAVATPRIPQRTDAAPPTVEAPTYGCTQGTPGAVGTVATCQVTLVVNGRANTVVVTLNEGRTIP